MSTANKLTYLSTTKGKIKDSINLTGANIGNNDTFRSYSAKLRDGLVDAINDNCETLYNNFPKVTGIGNNITLNNTYEAPMRVNLKGNTYQYTTTGKNLIDVSHTTTSNGITSMFNSDGSLILNGTMTAQWANITTNNVFILSAGTYTFSRDTSKNYRAILATSSGNNKTIAIGSTSATFTITEDLTIQRIYIQTASSSDLLTFNNEKIYFQLERGSSATSYEPYTGGIPSPNPSYPQDIEVVTGYNEIKIYGKNLLNKDGGFDKGYYNASGVWVNENVTCCLKNTPVKENTTYTYSTNTITRNKTVVFFDNSNTFIGRTQTQNNIKDYTFTTPANTRYARLMFVAVGTPTITQTIIDDLNIQLEEGSTATEYEPYQEQSYEINLGKNLFDGTFQQGGLDLGSTGAEQTISTRIRTDFIEVKPNTTYIVSTGNNNLNYVGIGLYKNDKTYDSANKIYSGSWNELPKSFTTQNDTKYVRMSLRKSDNSDITPNGDYEIQLEQGTSSTSYSPYFEPIELCKIGDYQDEIRKSTGKNLFDKDNLNELTSTNIDSSGTITTTSGCRTIYIPIKSNTTYTISKIPSTRFRVATYTDTPQVGSTTSNYTANITTGNTTITSGANDKYLAVWLYYISTDTLTYQQIIDTVQIELGSTKTDLEPYGKVWYKHSEIGKIVLDGSENWSFVSAGTGAPYGYFALLTTATQLNGIASSTLTLCDKFILNMARDTNYSYRLGNASYVQFVNTDISTAADFKTWLSTHNTIVYYPLATPTTEIITNEELIEQLNALENAKGYNNQTNVIAEYMSGNQPIIMGASALLKEE